MASAARFKIPIKAVLVILGSSIAAGSAVVFSKYDVRRLLLQIVTGPGSFSRVACILFALLNVKNLPFIWHYRVFNAILGHIEFPGALHFTNQSPRSATDHRPYGPAALFRPAITTSYNALTECDYNMHKSNSTYFSDLDVSRSHIISCLLRRGIRSIVENPGQVRMPDGSAAKGSFSIMLGSVQCSFKKEIPVLARYEMWSRILCWDRKWIYVVTHFVKAGAVKPNGIVLDDGSIRSRLFGARSRKGSKEPDLLPDREGKTHPAVYASAVSRYCTKIGRFTMHPEVLLNASKLLPARPGGWNLMDGKNSEAGTDSLDKIAGTSFEGSDWDWKRVEAENARGMQFANHAAGLDGLLQEFTGEDAPALGRYRDLIW